MTAARDRELRAFAASLERCLCFKHGCMAAATTVEVEEGQHPNALCDEHAVNPSRHGTFDSPTIIVRS